MTAYATPIQDTRDGARRNMFLAAQLRRGSQVAPVKIRNMSASGALLDSPIVPEPNSIIELVRGKYVAHGRVVWSEPKRCGIRFTSELSVNDWLAPIEAQPVFLADPVPPPAAPPAELAIAEASIGNSQAVTTVAVEDLLQVAKLVEQVARTLARDPHFLSDHMTEGRNLICAMQMLSRMSAPVRD